MREKSGDVYKRQEHVRLKVALLIKIIFVFNASFIIKNRMAAVYFKIA